MWMAGWRAQISILSVSAKKSSTYLLASITRCGTRLCPTGGDWSFCGLCPPLLFCFVMFIVATLACPWPEPWPTTILGSPTMLEPTVPRGDTECIFGCTSVVPVPDIAPTGLVMKEEALLDLLCKMLSTVFSMNTRLFFIVSPLFGEFDIVLCFWLSELRASAGAFLGSVKDPESPF